MTGLINANPFVAVLKTLSHDELLLELTSFRPVFNRLTGVATAVDPSCSSALFGLSVAFDSGVLFFDFCSSFSFLLNQRKKDWKPVLDEVELEVDIRESLFFLDWNGRRMD